MKPAGQSTRALAQKRRRKTNIVLVSALVFVILLGVIIQNWRFLGLGAGLTLALLIVLSAIPDWVETWLRGREKQEKRADRGAAAEESIAELLPTGDGICVLHDIKSPYGNIDHIVLSRFAGIFIIETKSHFGRVNVNDAGELLVNNRYPEKNFIKQVLQNTYWLRGQLEEIVGQQALWVNPIIVFTNAFVPPSAPIKGVKVINKKYLPNELMHPRSKSYKMEHIWEARERVIEKLA